MALSDFECVICAAGGPDAVIAESRHCWVTAPPRAPLPGYVCVVSKTHVVEPFELSRDEQAAFWLDVCSVAKAVRAQVASPKINYEIHGNTISHLHLHVYPRYPDDPFTGRPIDGASRDIRRTPAELRALGVATRRALA
jgi:diadenosine tetraphosphate (Ap4A) HIT family hydrolase